MRLSHIHENEQWPLNPNILDQTVVFKTMLYLDPEEDMPEDELRKHFTEFYTKFPPPGISPIVAQTVKVDLDSMSSYTGRNKNCLDVYTKMTIEDFIRNSVQYGVDAYDIIKEIKRAAGPEAAAAAYEFMQTTGDLNVARIGGSGGGGGLSVDNWPTNPNL